MVAEARLQSIHVAEARLQSIPVAEARLQDKQKEKVTKEANYGPSASTEVGATEADSSMLSIR